MPSRARRFASFLVGQHAGVDDVGEPAFEARIASIDVLPAAFLASK
jgi:hypothetical protein